MSKLPEEIENPVDNILIAICEQLSPHFRSANFTPNAITTISLIFGIASIYSLGRRNYVLSAALYLVSYLFDCCDGYYARKYKMVSEFGDHYDHIKDMIVSAGIFYFLIKYYWHAPLKIQLTITAIFAFLTVTLWVHLGCQEKYYHHGEKDLRGGGTNNYLNHTHGWCAPDDKDDIYELLKRTRHFGSGTYNLFIAAMIAYLSRLE